MVSDTTPSSQPIGATVVYSWKDDPEKELTGYISFSEWEDNADADSFGIADTEIFFYSSHDDFTRLLEIDGEEDFWVRSYEYQHIS